MTFKINKIIFGFAIILVAVYVMKKIRQHNTKDFIYSTSPNTYKRETIISYNLKQLTDTASLTDQSCISDTMFTKVTCSKLQGNRTFYHNGQCFYDKVGENRFLISLGNLPDFTNYLVVDSSLNQFLFIKTPLQKWDGDRMLQLRYDEIDRNNIVSDLRYYFVDSTLHLNLDLSYSRPLYFETTFMRQERIGSCEYYLSACSTCLKSPGTLPLVIANEAMFSSSINIDYTDIRDEWNKAFTPRNTD